MGICSFTAPCLCCGRVFSFHPNKVPSINGQPICEDCVKKANPIRIAEGLPPITYAPDAYKQALDEDNDRIDWGD